MSKRKKRLEKICQNPKNVSFEELRKVLEDYGFELDRIRGSHHTFRLERENSVINFVVPYARLPLKPIYIKRAVEIIDELNKEEDDDAK
jgi:predicted RNA binding protein YcfA (HicA-like mRNA interferase family)